MSSSFEPLNDLETCLLQAQRGTVSAADFLDTLNTSKIALLVDKDPGPSGAWDETANLLVLSNASENSVIALFTAPERATEWVKLYPQFCFAFLTDFSWLIKYIAPGLGIVINPGLPVGLEMAAARVQQMQIDALKSSQ